MNSFAYRVCVSSSEQKGLAHPSTLYAGMSTPAAWTLCPNFSHDFFRVFETIRLTVYALPLTGHIT